MMAYSHRRKGKGRPPQALCPRRRLLPSLKLGPRTGKFGLPPPSRKFVEENQYEGKQCCGNILCFLTFLVNPVSENCAHLRGGGGGGQLVQVLGRYVTGQNRKVDP